jgi:hypothetical protein
MNERIEAFRIHCVQGILIGLLRIFAKVNSKLHFLYLKRKISSYKSSFLFCLASTLSFVA